MLATCGTDHGVRGLARGFLRLCSLAALRNLLGGGSAPDLWPGAAMHRHVLAALWQIQPGIADAGMEMALADVCAVTGDLGGPWPYGQTSAVARRAMAPLPFLPSR